MKIYHEVSSLLKKKHRIKDDKKHHGEELSGDDNDVVFVMSRYCCEA